MLWHSRFVLRNLVAVFCFMSVLTFGAAANVQIVKPPIHVVLNQVP